MVQIARELIGKILITDFNHHHTSGIIAETEAYAGTTDKASHAFGRLRSKRTENMYHEGGITYIYLCYGIHSLFNVVTNIKDVLNAVLIRTVKHLDGIKIMLERIKKISLGKIQVLALGGGPNY